MGGKSSPPPPDYSGLERVANRQLDFAERQYADIMPFARQVYGTQMEAQRAQMGIQREQMDQARDYYNYQRSTFRPLEMGLVSEAQSYNTEDNRARIAARASADAQAAFASSQQQQQRMLNRMGVNPMSGAYGAMSNQGALGLAAMQSNAANQARNQAEQLGWARKMDAAGLGRGLAGASAAAYGGAVGAGSAGVAAGTAGMGTLMGPGTQFQQGLSNAAGTFGNIVNSQTSMYNTAANQPDPFMSLLGAGIGAYGAFKGSDRRLKQNIELVGHDERTGLAMYEFEYKGGDGRRFVGVMADEVAGKFPDAVATMPNGYMAVNYDAIGVRFAEVTHG